MENLLIENVINLESCSFILKLRWKFQFLTCLLMKKASLNLSSIYIRTGNKHSSYNLLPNLLPQLFINKTNLKMSQGRVLSYSAQKVANFTILAFWSSKSWKMQNILYGLIYCFQLTIYGKKWYPGISEIKTNSTHIYIPLTLIS